MTSLTLTIMGHEAMMILLSCVGTYLVLVLFYYAVVELDLLLPRLSGKWWEAIVSYSFMTGIISINILIWRNDSAPVQFLRGMLWVFSPLMIMMWIIIFSVMIRNNPDLVWGAILGHIVHMIAIGYLIWSNKIVSWETIAAGWLVWTIYTMLLYKFQPQYPILWYFRKFWQTWGLLTISAVIIGVAFFLIGRNVP